MNTIRDVHPGHGRTGIQKARRDLLNQLYTATERVLGPSEPWVGTSDQRFPFFAVRDSVYETQQLEVLFSDNISITLNPWPFGPGSYEPSWYYEAKANGYNGVDRDPSKFLSWRDEVVETPSHVERLIKAWAVVFAKTQVVES
jgi:hypothetical protein